MKSADSMRRAVRVAALAGALAALGACSSLPQPGAMADRAAAAVGTSAKAALQVLTPAPAAVSAEVQAQFDRALQAQRAGRDDDALRQWAALAQTQPELGGVHANIGLIHRQAGRYAEAVAALEAATRASPTQPRFFNELGIAYRLNGQFSKAQQAYEGALALDPNHASALLNLGILHDLYLGNGAKALELYERYLALAPGGDAAVSKWAADLRQRKGVPLAALNPAQAQAAKNGKESP